jgi:ribosomal protein S18 acetylase RimI-like enzyme
MRLEDNEKTGLIFERIWDITKASFDGVELPPRSILEHEYGQGTVFITKATWPPVDAGKIVSYALLREKYGEPYLWAIATDPEWRGKGLAGGLLREVENFVKYILKDAAGIGLATNVNNPAQKLYFDHGYRVIKHLPGYYGQGNNGLFMRRPLL